MQITPYLHYEDQCAEAFAFYAKALGGRINMMSRYGDAPADSRPPGADDLVMHAELDIDGALLHGSDAPPEYRQARGGGFTVALQVDTIDQAESAYAALSDGGQVTMPLAETFWAHRFAMLTDRFGIPWMINCQKAMG